MKISTVAELAELLDTLKSRRVQQFRGLGVSVVIAAETNLKLSGAGDESAGPDKDSLWNRAVKGDWPAIQPEET